MNPPGTTPPLPAALTQALHDLASRDAILVATDFDGTLAGFSVDPNDSAPAPGGMQALRALARMRDTTVAVCSGRDVATLAELTGVGDHDAIALIGSHGAESTAASVGQRGLDHDQRALLDELTTQVAELIEGHPGARLERKRAAVAVHTRGLADDDANAALREANRLAQDRVDVRVIAGKSVVELSVAHADKGTALQALADSVGADVCFYSGDDVTDEDAFVALSPDRGDVTVKVGAGDTAASFRVDSVADVVSCLQLVARLRADQGRRG